MNIEKIHEIAYKAMGKRKSHLQREKGFVYYHAQRVAKLSINLRKRLFPDDATKDDVIYAAALFHDVTKGIEPHAVTGAHLVKSLLANECTAEELEQISRIILLHNTRKHGDLPFYIKIVQDADVLDHFGSMEVWLNFQYQAHEDGNVFDSIQHWESDEHKNYLEASRKSLNYELSREIFHQKEKFQLAFLERFVLEMNGEIE